MIQVSSLKKISCLDLKRQHQELKSEIFAAFEKVYDSTAFSGGSFVEEFETNFADFCNVNYAVAVNNGTSALHLALLALGIGPGDEVILPVNTFVATAWAVSYVGAKPVFVDCTHDTWQIDTMQIEAVVSSRTRAVIGVHLYGQPFDVDQVQRICARYKLALVEDAAQAQGAGYKGCRVGGFGELGCFSFYPGKNLGSCGEAGGITTNNPEYFYHLRRLRNHGSEVRYHHEEIGYNMRMGGLEGAALNVKLPYLAGWNQRRKAIAKRYQLEIRNHKLEMQTQPEWSDSVYHLFVVTTPERDKLINYLSSHEIYPGLHYPVPLHLQRAYRSLGYQKGDFPNAEYLAAHCCSLPMYPELTEEETTFIIDILNRY
jgi:dTDP-4-amino-4,6-dideoxygalactose transaminase